QAGAYFVTICTADRQGPLGWVEGTEMRLSALGQIAEACWQVIPEHFEDVVMPNHVHGIVVIGDGRARHASPLPARPQGPGRRSVGSIVGAYKSSVCRRVNAIGGTPGAALWQRNYYEHVIRNERQLSRIRRYIEGNPANWMLDYENPQGQCYGQGEKERFFTY
ncbi:MAG: transposase, partial [Planctomycetota bacterium]|nr:transposase [Planctomycetota bacterium]